MQILQYNTAIVQEGFSGNGNNNFYREPIFINSPSYTLAPFTNGDYRLSVCSPAINTGNKVFIPAGISTNIIGAARIQQSTVDKALMKNKPGCSTVCDLNNPLVQSVAMASAGAPHSAPCPEALYFANKRTSVGHLCSRRYFLSRL